MPTQTHTPAGWWVAVWAVALLFITGCGDQYGGRRTLSAWAMATSGSCRGRHAAAAINTVQLMCGAFSVGLAGVVSQPQRVTAREASAARGGLFGVFAVLAALTVIASSQTRGRV